MTATSTFPDSARPATRDSVIRCVGLSKTFRDFWHRPRVRAVDQLDLDVQRGEIFGLLGPNGSGKSTTIKMLLGLLHPTAGKVAVFGRHPRDVAIKQDIGYLPEQSYLYKFLNARETLEYYGRLYHQSRGRRGHRIDTLLEMVGLDQIARRPVGEYSKGMQRRIGLAQALINDPQLLILDEPTTGMDPIGTRQIKDLLRELARRGKTILLCSHLLADVEDVCDRVSIMFGGKVRQHGTVEELLVQEGVTTVSAADLDEDDVQAIEQLLQGRGKHIDRVEQPRQKLETLFLDIVQKARAEGAATSGATAGGPLADFLSADSEASASSRTGPENAIEAAELLHQLTEGNQQDAETNDQAEQAPLPENHEPASEMDSASEAGPENHVLEDLVRETETHQQENAGQADRTTSSQPAPPSAEPPAPEEESAPHSEPEPTENVDESLLESLMGEPKHREERNPPSRRKP